jgi:hypothetical protein
MTMSEREVEEVVQSIPHEIPHVPLADKRSYDGGRSFVLDCVDLRTDETFTVYDLGDWWARVQQQIRHRAQA